MVIGRRSLLLAGVAVPVAAHSQCVTDTPSVDACRGGVRITQPPGATLDLSFFGPTLDPSLTFTRGSVATYFDATGVMRTAQPNLCLWSGDASNAAWQKISGTVAAPVVTGNQVAAPDGTVTAARAVFPAVSVAGTFSNLASAAIAVPTNGTYTMSIWLRGNVGGEQVNFFATADAVNYFRVRATLTTAWQRFVVTLPSIVAGSWFLEVGCDLRDVGQAGIAAQTVYVWGAQFEQNPAASNYSPTTTVPVNNQARFDNDPVTHAALGLLIEEQRTNLILRSANVADVAWGQVNFGGVAAPTVTAAQATAPDGTLTAASVAFPAVVATASGVYLTQALSVAAAPYAFSIWAKGNAGGEQLYLFVTPDGVTYYRAPMTLTTAWQRFTLVTPALTAASWTADIGIDRRDASQANHPAQTVFLWGGQLEQGAFPTSYIPTTAAAVTRSADVLRIPPANMGFFTSPGGSWMAEFIEQTPLVNIQNGRIVSAPNGGGIAPIFLQAGVSQFDGAGILGTANSLTAPGTVVKGASTYTAGTATVCLNGGAVATSATLTTGYGGLVASGLAFLVTVPAGNAENETGYIRRVRYWPRVLSNAELQSVTR